MKFSQSRIAVMTYPTIVVLTAGRRRQIAGRATNRGGRPASDGP
jgi:hypothetical protein